MKNALATLLAFCIAAPALAAQESEPPAPAPQDTLEAALETLATRDQFMLAGSIATEQPEADAGQLGTMQTRVIIGGLGEVGGSAEYQGHFEVWRTPEGETSIVSRSALPGIAFYADGERTLTQVTVEEDTIDPRRLVAEVRQLLDLERLRRGLKKVKLEVTPGVDGAPTMLRGELSRRLVEADSGGFDPLSPKVLRLDATFELAPDGALQAMEFRLLRSDPLAAVRRRALAGGVPDAGGNVEMRMEVDPATMGSELEEEGAVSVYRLDVSSGAPSDRTKEFVSDMRDLLANEGV